MDKKEFRDLVPSHPHYYEGKLSRYLKDGGYSEGDFLEKCISACQSRRMAVKVEKSEERKALVVEMEKNKLLQANSTEEKRKSWKENQDLLIDKKENQELSVLSSLEKYFTGKLNSLKPDYNPEPKTSMVDRLRMLYHLGVIDLLATNQEENGRLNARAMARVLAPLVDMKEESLKNYLNEYLIHKNPSELEANSEAIRFKLQKEGVLKSN